MKGSAKGLVHFGSVTRLPEQNRRATWRYEFSDRYKEKPGPVAPQQGRAVEQLKVEQLKKTTAVKCSTDPLIRKEA